MTDTPYSLPNFSIDLSGTVALVTGASSGLGRRFAAVLAAAGARVAATARRMDRLEALADEVRARGGICLPVELDVTDPSRFADVVDLIEAELGQVTILVNNAGVPDAAYATKMSVDLVDSVIATNVRAPFLLSCEIARRLMRSGSPGRIVNLSSIGAYFYDGKGAALYSISKAAIDRMTETLAVEWARFHINVNSIAPGAFSSEMTDLMTERLGDLTPGFPRHRLGDPAQLDGTLLYLCSPTSEFVTGTIIKVDDAQQPR